MDGNKIKIQKALEQYPNSVTLPTFHGSAGGRLLDEDLVVFRACIDAYRFELESLVFVVNDLLGFGRPQQ